MLQSPLAAKNDVAIATTALTKSYSNGRMQVLKGVDLSIRHGERVALIGSNGSGKSTLLKCLIGLHALNEGSVHTLGETFNKVPSATQRARLRKQTGFVFQKHCLVKRHSVLTNVVHGMLGLPGSWRAFTQATAPSDWRTKALSALEDVHLEDKAKSRADALSGGQQQRVAIARAIVRGPKLVIADEPAASLDPVSGKEVMDLFSDLARAHGITLLFTSHDMEHAAAYSDRIIALKAGQVLFDKDSDDVDDTDLQETFN
ncbi:Aliphatic sulfonates import ATP-binding protein SsuB [Roseibium album]|nr:Aliphatic sulfonates import ATP-binding protein SsuB [Roseibium album]